MNDEPLTVHSIASDAEMGDYLATLSFNDIESVAEGLHGDRLQHYLTGLIERLKVLVKQKYVLVDGKVQERR